MTSRALFNTICEQSKKKKMIRFYVCWFHLSKNCIRSRCALYMFPEDLSTLQLATDSVQEVPLAVKETIRKEFGLEV